MARHTYISKIYISKTWISKAWILLFLSVFFVVSGIAHANHHEEQETTNHQHQKGEHDRSIDPDKRAKKRDRKMHHRMMKKYDLLDSNEDGKVDLNEFLIHAESRFNEMDANGDQFVSDEEAKSHHKKMRKKHREMRKHHKQQRKERVDMESGK